MRERQIWIRGLSGVTRCAEDVAILEACRDCSAWCRVGCAFGEPKSTRWDVFRVERQGGDKTLYVKYGEHVNEGEWKKRKPANVPRRPTSFFFRNHEHIRHNIHMATSLTFYKSHSEWIDSSCTCLFAAHLENAYVPDSCSVFISPPAGLIIRDDAPAVGNYIANYICKRINEFAPTAERPFVLGLPTGSSPIPTYKVRCTSRALRIGAHPLLYRLSLSWSRREHSRSFPPRHTLLPAF
jgi:hypothetical protein